MDVEYSSCTLCVIVILRIGDQTAVAHYVI